MDNLEIQATLETGQTKQKQNTEKWGKKVEQHGPIQTRIYSLICRYVDLDDARLTFNIEILHNMINSLSSFVRFY